MSKPELNRGGQKKGILICVNGPDNAAKVALMSDLHMYLIEQGLESKIIYSPDYSSVKQPKRLLLDEIMHLYDLAEAYRNEGVNVILNPSNMGELGDSLGLKIDLIIDTTGASKVPRPDFVQFNGNNLEDVKAAVSSLTTPIEELPEVQPRPTKQAYTHTSRLEACYRGQKAVSLVKSKPGYYIPPSLSGNFLELYTNTLNSIIERNRQVKDDGLVPVATLVNVEQNDSASKSPLQLDIAEDMPLVLEVPTEVSLQQTVPKIEFDTLATAIFASSDISIEAISSEVQDWDYDKKSIALESIVQTHPELIHMDYRFELVLSLSQFCELAEVVSTKPAMQTISPKLGYEVPSSVIDAGKAYIYESCFDDSNSLYSKLFEQYDQQVASFGCLSGNRIRAVLNISFQELWNIDRSKTKNKVASSLVNIAKETHPALWMSSLKSNRSK